jgi:tRNA A37 N6-isopentenylltransferase MiaA
VRINDVDLPSWNDEDEAFLMAAKEANCLSAQEIEETRRRRIRRMEEIARGSGSIEPRSTDNEEEFEDGSLG